MALFDPLVDAYDAARPAYPPELYDGLDELVGPLDGSVVVEVGAGTGIATRGLLAQGARVVALDAASGMLRRLLERTDGPGLLGVVRGDAHALPVADAAADLVCYAQAWHWTDVPRAAAEAARVLRPHGALALWWNDVQGQDDEGKSVDWLQRQYARIEAGNPGWRRDYRQRDWMAELVPHGWSVEHVEWRWERPLPVEDYLVWLRSKSYVAAIDKHGGPGALQQFLDEERSSLLYAFPDGVVVEPFATRLFVARPQAG